MKLNQKNCVLTGLILLLLLGSTGFIVNAQDRKKDDDGPSLGREKKPAPADPNRPPKPRKRRPIAEKDKTGVPKGKTLEFYVRQGSELIDKGEYVLADAYFDEAEKRRNDRGVTPELIDLFEKQNQVLDLHVEANEVITSDVTKALANYEQILKLRPNDQKAKELIPGLYFKAAEASFEKKDYQASVEFYTRFLAYQPGDKASQTKLLAALLAQGEADFNAGKLDLAEKAFKRVLELDNKNAQAQQRLQALDILGILEFAENKLKSGAYEDAFTKFKEVLALDPTNERAKKALPIAEGNVHKLKAEQFYRNRKYSEAAREYQAARTFLANDGEIKQRLDELAIRLMPASPLRGKVTWRGKVSKPTKVVIKGSEINYLEGPAPQGATLTERLPLMGYTVKQVKKISGKGKLKLAEMPTAANDFAAVVQVDAKNGDNIVFEVEWELKRQGALQWTGQAAGKSLIRVQGPFVDVEQPNGQLTQNGKLQGELLPMQEANIQVRKLSGAAEIKVLESPSAANSYIATLTVEGAAESSEIAFELTWELKGK
jgi:tetratricopeptide (TPR) repeat protein